MAYQNEMADITKVMEKVPVYTTWHPAFTGNPTPTIAPTGTSKVVQDSLKSHQNSHDK
jgi:hypothetical protein